MYQLTFVIFSHGEINRNTCDYLNTSITRDNTHEFIKNITQYTL